MRKHLIYYALKPYLPGRLRLAARQFSAGIKRKDCHNIWPIDAKAGNPPPDWGGWPERKKFALVLTHDVEGPEGLACSQRLAEVEMELGFRSSFNFVPEGTYSVPASLRHWLTRHGFEVGVHDLHHDGKLYRSEKGFRQKARRINHYLREWGAVGFRSGFMLRNLDWLHDLEIQYDASTFDTDPFEFQANGEGTIFPFWVNPPSNTARPGTKGYLELPYTLPQDSTLFLALQERSPVLWLRKLDWLAAHGGMALVNVHPDYIGFGPDDHGPRKYPLSHYRDTLLYLKERYAGEYWHVLPSELASWYTKAHPTARKPARPELAGRRAAVLLYSTYPADPRPRRAAEALVESGMEVDLLSLSESPQDPRHETIKGVNVSRMPLQRSRGSKLTYFWLYTRFFVASFLFLTRRGLRRRYDVVHVHNMPDFLVFAAIVPKLRGAKVILDLHDPMPELMVTIYDLPRQHVLVSLLRQLERWSIAFANLALTPNASFKKLFVSRSCRQDKMQIVMNSPQQEIFNPDRFAGAPEAAPGNNEELRVMHHGSIVHRHGVDILVEAIALVNKSVPARLDIYGAKTPFLQVVIDTARTHGIADRVHYHGPLDQSAIADAIRRCHVGVVPNRRSVFTEINFPTRLFEYLSMHRPVIAPDCSGIHDCFNAADMLYFKPGDAGDLAAKLLWVRSHPEEVREMVGRGVQVYREHLWVHEKARFQGLVSSLVGAS